MPDGSTRQWNHLYVNLPVTYRFNERTSRFDSLAAFKGDVVARRGVFMRSLTELKTEAVETVIDLIEDNNLYRGSEFLKNLQEFLNVKKSVEGITNLENYCWLHYDNPIAKIRNTAMGTLLINLSEGMDLERAVKAYENIMAPTNYKRPNALITKKQIAQAQKTVEELGLVDALPRRHAQVEDISVNDVLFVNRDTAKRMIGGSMLDMLSADKPVNPKEFTKATEVTIEQFLNDILPGSTNVEALVENNHIPNFVTLTAPVNKDAGNLFKWNNNFAWVYNGSVADSFKEKVKAAGGNVEGFMRCSLHWFNYDDLDLHVKEPTGYHIYYSNRRSNATGGYLDVDMNAGSGKTRDAVENIVWTDRSKLAPGRYTVFVNQFNKREGIDVGFEFEIEVDGELHKFAYDKVVKGNVTVAYIDVSRNGITVSPVLPSNASYKSKTEWSIDTMKFQKVSCIMLSPNHWEGNSVGNKHYFFMLDGCKNPDPVRGFFNEYLRADLEKDHRRVFEALASKAKTEYSDNQLSGLGFSNTQRNELIVKVDNKTFKIKF